MDDLRTVPRGHLQCRGYGHGWDFGSAPVQVDERNTTEWVSRGRCTSCGTRKAVWLVKGSCERSASGVDYDWTAEFREGMRRVTQAEARAELARRDHTARRLRSA